MTQREIVDLLREYNRARIRQKEIRIQLIKFIVESGLTQDAVKEIDVVNFFDGYLFALGHAQGWREKNA